MTEGEADGIEVIRLGNSDMATMRINAQTSWEMDGFWGLSVYSIEGLAAPEIARRTRQLIGSTHRSFRRTTRGRLEAEGYPVVNCDQNGHCDLMLPDPPSDDDWARLQELFGHPERIPEETNR